MVPDQWFFDNSGAVYTVIRKALKSWRFDRRYHPDDLLGSAWVAFDYLRNHWREDGGASFLTYYMNYAGGHLLTWMCSEAEWVHFRLLYHWRYARENDPRRGREKTQLHDEWLLEKNLYHDRKWRFFRIPRQRDESVEQILTLYDDLPAGKLMEHLFSSLDDRQKYIIQESIIHSRTIRDLAKELNITYQRVSQIYQQAIRKMQTKVTKLTEMSELLGIYPSSVNWGESVSRKANGVSLKRL